MVHMTHEQLALKPAKGQLVAACGWVRPLQQLTCTGRSE